MDKATAVEVAHHIQQLLKTREAIRELEGCGQAYITDDVVIQVLSKDSVVRTVAIPFHVMRELTEVGYILDSCKRLEFTHEQALRDLAGIVVGED